MKNIYEFYPQDGGESQLSLKLRHCHPMYSRALAFFRCSVVIVHTRLLCAFYNKRMIDDLCDKLQWSRVGARMYCQLS